MPTRCSDRLALAGVGGALIALAWAGPAAATTHTVPPGRIAAARQLLQEAEKRAGRMPAGKGRTDYLLGIASLRARTGDLDAGLRALGSVSPPYDFSHGPDVQMALQAVATALARAGRQADALGVVGHARDDVGRDRVLAGIAVARVEAGDRPGALATLRSPRGVSGPQSTMVEAYLLARDGQASEAHRLGAGLGDDTWEFGFVQRAHAQARVGDVAGARVTAGHIPPGDLRESGQAAIASGQARGGDVAGALATAGRLPEPTRSLAHADIAIAQAQRGDVPGALRTAGLVQIPGNQARALEAVARASARAGNVTEALRIARSMSFAEYRHTAIRAAVEAQAERGDLPGASLTIASLTIATLAPDEQRGMEFVVALARARAGDASPMLKIFSAPGPDSILVDALLAEVMLRLLRVPAEDPASSPFWIYDSHPFPFR